MIVVVVWAETTCQPHREDDADAADCGKFMVMMILVIFSMMGMAIVVVVDRASVPAAWRR